MEEKTILWLRQWAEDQARNCIFPFWTNPMLLDEEHGGIVGRITLDMEIDNSEPRGLTLTGRMLYAFSTAYRKLGLEVCRERAQWVFRDLVNRFYDREFGGAFTTVTAEGQVLSDDKPNYCEAFLIMGCAAYYSAVKDEQALSIAMEAFDRIETKTRFAPGCYYSNMTRQWEKAEGMGFGSRKNAPGFPEGAVVFPHHLCQAYVALYQATGDQRVAKALNEMLDFVIEPLYDSRYRCFKTITDGEGHRIGTRQSYGHDCEITYLAWKVANLVGTPEQVEKMRQISIQVLGKVLERDFDSYGSLLNGGDLVTGQTEKSHVWWAQAEAVTAMLCGYELTENPAFLEACEKQARYIDQYFVNREHGDWYNNVIVDEQGWRVVDGMHGFDKLNGGKCPFHNSQMCFEVMDRTDSLMNRRSGT